MRNLINYTLKKEENNYVQSSQLSKLYIIFKQKRKRHKKTIFTSKKIINYQVRSVLLNDMI